MADLPETESYDAGVYQLETTDPVIGGVDGKSNAAARNLSNRTKWLKARIDGLLAETSMSDHEIAANPHTVYATKVGLQTNTYNHVVAGGTANAITATYTPAYAAWSDGMTFFVEITAANTTTTPTVSPNGLSAVTIVKGGGDALLVGDLQIGMIAEFKYNSTLNKALLQNPSLKGVMSLAGKTSQSVSRVANTNYQNTLPYPIMVNINFSTPIAGSTRLDAICSTSPITPPSASLVVNSAWAFYGTSAGNMTIIVPSGWYYMLYLNTGNNPIINVWEIK